MSWATCKKSRNFESKFNKDTYLGHDTLTEVMNNRTVQVCTGNIIDMYNLASITPYHKLEWFPSWVSILSKKGILSN